MRRCVVVALLLALVSSTVARAEIYQYMDGNGTVHFVDDPAKIPRKLQKKKRIVDAEPSLEAIPNTTRMTVVGNQVLIPVTLHHNNRTVKATFLLDTGASTTTISEDLAEKLGIDSGKLVLGQVAGGGLLLAMRVRLDSIYVGPTSRMDMEVDVIRHDGPHVRFDGLLGMNYLRNYHYLIDFNARLIRWG